MPIWTMLISPLTDILKRVLPDEAAKQAAQATLQQMVTSGELQQELTQLIAVTTAQTDINKVEAASTSLFVAGWRPFVGWVCGVGLAMNAIIGPLFNWISIIARHPLVFPVLEDPFLKSTMAAMLGIGYGLRTFEKSQGIAGNH